MGFRHECVGCNQRAVHKTVAATFDNERRAWIYIDRYGSLVKILILGNGFILNFVGLRIRARSGHSPGNGDRISKFTGSPTPTGAVAGGFTWSVAGSWNSVWAPTLGHRIVVAILVSRTMDAVVASRLGTIASNLPCPTAQRFNGMGNHLQQGTHHWRQATKTLARGFP